MDFLSALIHILVIVLGLLVAFKLYFLATLGVCKSTKRLVGKTVIITGANTGIGKETALDLAKRGAKVILACRDFKRGAAARDDIIALSGNENVYVRQLDLSSLQSVRDFAADIIKNETRLDILVNNAGCALMERKLTDDGLEYQMQSNYFGHFLLTNLLLRLIVNTHGARIINISSSAHKWPKKLDLTDLNFERDPSANRFMVIYGYTKLCNILFTKELAVRLEATGFKSVTVNSLHPGAVKTEIFRHATHTAVRVLKTISFLARQFCKTAKEGAQTTIHLAVADDVANVTGQYFSDCKIAKTSELANDAGLARILWETSEALVKLAPEERLV